MTVPGFTEEWFHPASQEVLACLGREVTAIAGQIIEIGSWEGRSTIALANAIYPRALDCVDTWAGSEGEISYELAASRDVFAQWTANVTEWTKGNVVPHRMGWREYVPTITGPVALAFIDAEHTYAEVFDNVTALLPLMAPGGIICGDDVHHPPIREALNDLFGSDWSQSAALWIYRVPNMAKSSADMAARFPTLAPDAEEWASAQADIIGRYRDYADVVSEAAHAVSLETATYLRHLCRMYDPAKVLDLGSGFSSWVLRVGGADVRSVDTDAGWARKTEAFCGLPDGTVLSWDDHKAMPGGPYDLIFVDLANGDERELAMIHAVPMLAPGGVIVFDDTHHPGHDRCTRQLAGFHGLSLFPLECTVDAIGRHASVAVRTGLGDRFALAAQTPSDINEHLHWFVDCVRLLNAQQVIELGSRSGVSTVAWLFGLAETGGRLTSVDLDPAPEIGTWSDWEHIQGDDMDPDVIARLEPADIVFIDTSHLYSHTVAELNTYRWLVKPGGLLVCHDSNVDRFFDHPPMEPSYPVRKAIREFVADTGFDAFEFPHCNGLTIIKVV